MTAAAVQASGAEPAPRTEPDRPRPLKRLAVRGSIWTLGGYALQRVLRLGGNLVLTRLLFPEAFGLMALVQVVLQGVQMFSDTGVSACVIRAGRGDDASYLDTAWTIQVVRGSVLWLCTCILAWPMAWFYDARELTWLIPIVGLSCILSGFQSTAVLTLRRQVNLRPLVFRDLVAQVAGLVVMIGWAVISPSLWALVAGALTNQSVSLLISHLLIPARRPRFLWDRTAAGEMFRFGRWIFVSTLVTFFIQQGDKAVVGKVAGMAELGLFAIAWFWSRSVIDVLLRLNSQVLFPIYSRLANANTDSLRGQVFRVRTYLLVCFLPILWGLAIFGDELIGFLYDPRYVDAGWMLQILAVGGVGAVVSVTTGGILLAVGDSYRYMLVQLARGALLIIGMVAGASLGGFPGLLIGLAASKILDYPVIAWAIHKYGVWLPKLDGIAFVASMLVIGGGTWLIR